MRTPKQKNQGDNLTENINKGLQGILQFAVSLPAAPVQWIKDCSSGAQLSVLRAVWHSPACDHCLRWKFVQLWAAVSGTCWHEPAVPMQMFLIPSAPSTTEHTACGQLFLPLSHVLVLPNSKNTWRISGSGEGFGVKAGTPLCLAGLCPGSQLYEKRPNVHPGLSVPRHSCGEESCWLSAPCCDFYVHISACIAYVLLCKPARVCWLDPKSHSAVSSPTCAGCHLLTESVAWRFYPAHELMPKGNLLFWSCESPPSPLTQVCRLWVWQQWAPWAHSVGNVHFW